MEYFEPEAETGATKPSGCREKDGDDGGDDDDDPPPSSVELQ